MNQIAVVQFVHLESQRLPGKVLHKLGPDSLLEIAIRKLSELAEWDNNIHPIYICPEYDKPIINLFDKYGVEYYLMNKEQASNRIWPELIQPFLFYLKDYDRIWDINLVCRPFMSLLSLREIAELCHTLTFSFTVALQQKGIVWDGDRNKLIGHGLLADTRCNPSYLTLGHIAYVWMKEHLGLEQESLAARCIPVPMSFKPEELIDIDTVADYEFARRLI